MDLIGPIREGQTPLIDLDNPPDWTKPEWFLDCPNTPHIDTELHRGRLLLASQFVHELIENTNGLDTLADYGAGDGGLLETLKDLERDHEDFRCWGYDLSVPSVEYARLIREVDVWHENVFGISGESHADVVVATEFLEHLVDPWAAVRLIRARNSRYLIASSPYTETAEHHYSLHTWAFDLNGYKALLEDSGFEVIRQETVDMFQVCLAVAR